VNREGWLVRCDSGAFVLWYYPQAWTIGAGDEVIHNVSIDRNGHFVYCGTTSPSGESNLDYTIAVTGEFYAHIAGTSYGGTDQETAPRAIACHDSGYILVGTTAGVGPSNTNAYVVKTGADCFSVTTPPIFTTGLQEKPLMTTQEWLVYPNPANDYLFVQLPLESELCWTMSLLDRTGSVVFTSKCKSGTRLSLDVASFSPGLYLMMIDNGSQRLTQKFELY
jgi:hypothetical protein